MVDMLCLPVRGIREADRGALLHPAIGPVEGGEAVGGVGNVPHAVAEGQVVVAPVQGAVEEGVTLQTVY